MISISRLHKRKHSAKELKGVIRKSVKVSKTKPLSV